MNFTTGLEEGFLRSLSLKDETYSEEMDIDMDIDMEEAPDEEPPEVDPVEPPNLLSPTTLGAYMAMRPRLLLPPPKEYDIELDTSQMRPRNVSVFHNTDSSSLQDEYVYDPSNRDYHKVEPLENGLTKSYKYRQMEKMLKGGERSEISSPSERSRNLFEKSGAFSQSDSFQSSFQSDSFQSDSFQSGFRPLRGQVQSSFDSYGFQGSFRHPSVHHHYHFNERSLDRERLAKTQAMVRQSQVLEPLESQYYLPPPWKQGIHPHERYPYILSSYLQLTLNVILSGYGLYTVFAVVRTIKGDIESSLLEQSQQILAEVDNCKRLWYENECAPETVVPLLRQQCEYWYKCMHQSPNGQVVATSAQTMGLIVNSLVEPLSLKFIAVMMIAVAFAFFMNVMFGYVRAKMYWGTPENRKESEKERK